MSPTKNVALVVGASRGIGRQIAVELARNGYAGNHHDTLMTFKRKEKPS